jgi:Cu(I)/Ag(I) efflux system membrane protein CusA/SilA
MYETVVTYKPKYRVEADGTRVRQWREHINTPEDIWQEIVAVAEVPGMTSAPLLQPINARIVMLQTGMRAPMGMKVRGPDLATIEKVGLVLEDLLREVPGVRPETVFAERTEGKPYLEIRLKRESMARLGLSVQAVQDVIQVGVGGMPLTQTVEGRERYPVRVRYMREDRDSIEALMRLSVPTPSGAQVPLEQVAEIMYVRGPQSIKSEDTFLTGYVIFDKTAEVAEADVVERAQRFLQEKIDSGEFVLPAGVSYVFTGSYENQVRSEKRLKVLIPIALAVIFLLLYLQFRSTFSALIIYTGVVVAVSGGFILIWLYGQPWFLNFDVFGTSMQELFQVAPMNLSVAVWIGVIALVGIATDDGVVMSTYLKQQFDEFTPDTRAEIRARVLEAGLRRVRPCLLTTGTTLLALLPVVTSQGRGSDIMVPMAIPALGGMAIELVTLFIVPVLYCADQEIRLWWRQRNPLTELEEKDP